MISSFITSIQHHTGNLSVKIWEKEIKDIHIHWKEKKKNWFTNDMTYYAEIFKESTTKTETNEQSQADYRTQGWHARQLPLYTSNDRILKLKTQHHLQNHQKNLHAEVHT